MSWASSSALRLFRDQDVHGVQGGDECHALAFHLLPAQATITLPADSRSGPFHGRSSRSWARRPSLRFRAQGVTTAVSKRSDRMLDSVVGPAERLFAGDQASAGEQQFRMPAGMRTAVGDRCRPAMTSASGSCSRCRSCAGDFGGRVPLSSQTCRRSCSRAATPADPDLGGVVLDLALAVLGVFAAQHQAPGPAVDPAENAMERQDVQVAPDRCARGAAFGHSSSTDTCSRWRKSSPMRRWRSSVVMNKC